MPVWLASKGCKEVVANDLSEEYLKCYDKASKLLKLKNLTKWIGDASDLSKYPDKYFDSVSSVCVIEHLPLDKQARALKEWARVCKYRLGITFDYGNGADNPFRNPAEVQSRIIDVMKDTGMTMFGNLGYNYNPTIPYSSLDYTFGSIFFERVRPCVGTQTNYDFDKMNINKGIKLSAYMVAKDENLTLDLSLQSFHEEVDEIILVDTGSTDGTWETMMKWQQLIPSKIKIFKFNIIGYDLSEVRNFALSQCKDDWILVVDGDEVWTKEELVKVRKLISNAGDEVAFRPLSVRPLITFNKCEFGLYSERIFKNKVDITYKGVWPGDLSHHKEIPYYLYMPWCNIHYFHLKSMKPENVRIDQWALYHKLSNPEWTMEHCILTAKQVMHVNGNNPNAKPCPFPIPEILKDRLTANKEIKW